MEKNAISCGKCNMKNPGGSCNSTASETCTFKYTTVATIRRDRYIIQKKRKKPINTNRPLLL